MIIDNAISAPADSHQRHDDFLPLRAKVERHARIVFRHFPPSDREEAASEAVAVAFASFVRLKARGKNPERDFPSQMAHWAVLNVVDGRHISSSDVLSRRAQRLHGFRIHSLSRLNRRSVPELRARSGRQGFADDIEEHLYENARTPPGAQAIFRLDFRNWLKTWGSKDRAIIDDLVLGERTVDIASKHRISAGRVSQKRLRFRQNWERYCSDPLTEEDGRDYAA